MDENYSAYKETGKSQLIAAKARVRPPHQDDTDVRMIRKYFGATIIKRPHKARANTLPENGKIGSLRKEREHIKSPTDILELKGTITKVLRLTGWGQ